MARRAYFLLHMELLKDALRMPTDTTVVGAEWDWVSDSLRIVVEDPALKEVELGELLPLIVPTIHCGRDPEGHVRVDWEYPAENLDEAHR